jgi:hypothetical protein
MSRFRSDRYLSIHSAGMWDVPRHCFEKENHRASFCIVPQNTTRLPVWFYCYERSILKLIPKMLSEVCVTNLLNPEGKFSFHANGSPIQYYHHWNGRSDSVASKSNQSQLSVRMCTIHVYSLRKKHPRQSPPTLFPIDQQTKKKKIDLPIAAKESPYARNSKRDSNFFSPEIASRVNPVR